MNDPEKLIQEAGAVVSGHFVFKAGFAHGNLYMNKEVFSMMGARKLAHVIKAVGDNLSSPLSQCFKKLAGGKVGIIGPAYGAIPFSLTLAMHLESIFSSSSISFFPARTELVVESGRKVHTIPEKLLGLYQGCNFIALEDIVNNGTTLREVGTLFEEAELNIIAATCFVDRGGQTSKSLGIRNYHPLLRKEMEQFDVREAPCPMCKKGTPITTDLGKGAEWVEIFGQPPYPEGKDFSAFWE